MRKCFSPLCHLFSAMKCIGRHMSCNSSVVCQNSFGDFDTISAVVFAFAIFFADL